MFFAIFFGFQLFKKALFADIFYQTWYTLRLDKLNLN